MSLYAGGGLFWKCLRICSARERGQFLVRVWSAQAGSVGYFSVSLGSSQLSLRQVVQKGLVNQTPPKSHSPVPGYTQLWLSQCLCPVTCRSLWAGALQKATAVGDSATGGTLRLLVGSLWVFSPTQGYAVIYHPQQTDTVLILLISPDIFSAFTTWACNRKIFFAQRIRCRGRPTFCCKYCAEGYVVFTFLNVNKK